MKNLLMWCGQLAVAGLLLTACEKKKEDTPAPAPTADFTCKGPFITGDSTRFVNASTEATTYIWSFGDGATSKAKTPAHLYQKPGLYTVRLQASGAGGTAEHSLPVEIKAAPVPVANFTMDGTYVLGDSMRFTNTSQNATSYLWTFDDGTTSTKKSPSHVFRTLDWREVTLQATGPGGKTQVTKKIFVRRYPAFWWKCDCKVVQYLTVPRRRLPDEQVQLYAQEGDAFLFKNQENYYRAETYTNDYTEYVEPGIYRRMYSRYYLATDSLIVRTAPWYKYPADTEFVEYRCKRRP